MRLIVLCLLLTLSASGATYYVATNGNDSADGSIGTPWATLHFGMRQLVAGDTLFEQPGVYTNNFISDTVVTSFHDGTAANRITVKGIGNPTNRITGLTVTNAYWTLDGLTLEYITKANSHGSSAITIDRLATNTIITGCTIKNSSFQCTGALYMYPGLPDTSYGAVPWIGVWHPSAAACNCVISNNLFTGLIAGQCVVFAGSNNVAVNNTMRDLTDSDIVIFHGCSNVFRANYITNSISTGGNGCHPDIFQTFGCTDSILIPGQEANAIPTEGYGNTFENNVILNSSSALCQLNTVPPDTNIVFLVGGLLVRNNLFYRIGANVNGGVGSVDIPNTYFINNSFVQVPPPDFITNGSSPLNFAFISFTNFNYGASTGSVVMNNAFIDCGRSTNVGWYDLVDQGFPTNLWNFTGASNYVASFTNGNWVPKNLAAGYHGVGAPDINGGDPGIISFINPRPYLGSQLIDRGTNASAYTAIDLEGTTRPLGVRYDVGCYEFDSNLVMRLDFNQGFAATNTIIDVTGNSNNAINFNATNWIAATAGPNGVEQAGLFTIVGTMTNDPPNVYNLTQYAAVTNLNHLKFITNGTISAWVLWATNAERYDTILDCGYPPLNAFTPSAATNSWVIHYGEPFGMAGGIEGGTPFGPTFIVYGTNLTADLTHPALCMHFTQPRDGTNWWQMAVTWTNNTVSVYQNGQFLSSSNFVVPFLRVSTSAGVVTPWISVGAMAHDGTPQWADDPYPNSGFIKGRLDDIRIYDRALSATEITNLYSFAGFAQGPNPPPTPATFSAGTIRAGRVSKP